jgi:hypothetical protein
MITGTEYLAIFYGLILTVVHYYADRFNAFCRGAKDELLSFTAGISLTYICLKLLPESTKALEYDTRNIFVFILLGLVINHVIEKYVYQHTSRRKLLRAIKEAHSLAFFIYHLVIGVIMVYITRWNGFFGATLFLVPMFFHTGISKVSIEEIHVLAKGHPIIRIILSASTFIGVMIAVLTNLPAILSYYALGFVIGALLYIVIRDEIPEKKKGKLHYFVIGVLLYSTFIFFTWNH